MGTVSRAEKLLSELSQEIRDWNQNLAMARQKLKDAMEVMDRLMGEKEAEPDLLAKLSPREKEIFGLFGSGKGVGEIAKILDISRKTVEATRANMKKKLGIDTAADLAIFARENRG